MKVYDELEEGQLVDVLGQDGEWSVARIVQVENNKCLVAYSYLPDDSNEWICLDSTRIAPHHTHTYEDEGKNLRVGLQVDVLDVHPARMKWYRGEIVEAAEERVKVHRIGSTVDDDEYMPRNSLRIRPLGERTTRKRHSNHLHSIYRIGTGRMNINREEKDSSLYEDLTVKRERNIRDKDPRMVQYRTALRKDDKLLIPMEGDGNCLFRTISHQIYGTADHHLLVRERCMDYMESEALYFQPFVVGGAEDFKRYVRCKRKSGVWGDDIEIQAMCEIYNRPAEIYCYDARAGFRQLRTFHEGTQDRPAMKLSFYGGGHYDSIVDKEHSRNLLKIVGELEKNRISMSQRRNHENTASSSVAIAISDKEATEQAFLDEAIQKSRQQYDANAGKTVDQVLEQSLKQFEKEEQDMLCKVLHNSVVESDSAADDTMALKVSDIAATEQEALEQALKLSRQEYNSDSAVQNSLAEETRQLELAMEMSNINEPRADPYWPGDELTEDDELLQLAIAESLRQ